MTSVMRKEAPATVTTAMASKAADNLRKAKVQLVLHQPFFASIVLKRAISIDDSCQTAYCTANGKIVVGTEFFSKLTVAESVFVLAHEAMHYAMLHHQRVGWRKHRPANQAMDKVINDILIHSGLTAPKAGIFQAGAREYAWEQLYDENDDEGDGGGEGNGDGPYQPGTGHDDLSPEGLDGVTAEDVESIKRELIQARQASKSQGKMPAGMEALIEDIVNPPTPWHQLLERFMLLQIKAGSSWKRPNKRYVEHDIYLPSFDTQPKMGHVVIQMDESGSVGTKELEHFSGHINKIIEQCRPEKVTVLHTDSRVGKVEEFTSEDYPIKFKSYCGGGTDMTAGFKWVDEHGEEPDVFVTLTDGLTPWGEAPGYPVVWLITTHGIEAPHGETIYYEVTE